MADVEDYRKDMEAFFKMAKYPLVRQTDMSAEMREEAVDVCVTAVEKHQTDMEKCTQVDRRHGTPSPDIKSMQSHENDCMDQDRQ